jgi:hypothetical protein
VEGTDLLVLDAAMAVGMKLVEVDLASAGSGSAIGLDGNANEAELQIAFPTGTCGHGKINSLLPPCGIVPGTERGCRRDDVIPEKRQPSWGGVRFERTGPGRSS